MAAIAPALVINSTRSSIQPIVCHPARSRERQPAQVEGSLPLSTNTHSPNRISFPNTGSLRLWTPTKTNSVSGTGGGYKGGDVQIFAVSLNRAHILSTPVRESRVKLTHSQITLVFWRCSGSPLQYPPKQCHQAKRVEDARSRRIPIANSKSATGHSLSFRRASVARQEEPYVLLNRKCSIRDNTIACPTVEERRSASRQAQKKGFSPRVGLNRSAFSASKKA